MVTSPDRVGAVYAIVQKELRVHACIEIRGGKTRVWNRAGLRPEACNVLERIARTVDPTAVVWRGSDLTSRTRVGDIGDAFGTSGFRGTLSSKFEKTHPKTLSSETISSQTEDNFIQKRFHPNTFIQF